uniref:Uncharacterized protein n=1 Tax=Oryza punctata TaxID=4537 RepID=A0A0E0KC76_ORYPU
MAHAAATQQAHAGRTWGIAPRGRRRSPLRGWIRFRRISGGEGSGPHPHTLPTSTCSTSPPRLLPRYLSPPPPPPPSASHGLTTTTAASSSSSSSRLPAPAVVAARARCLCPPLPTVPRLRLVPPISELPTGERGVWKPADLGRSPPETGTGGGIQVDAWVQHMLFLTPAYDAPHNL